MSTRGSICIECGVDFYPDGVSHEHCNAKKCSAEIPYDNCDQDVDDGRTYIIPGSTKGFACRECGEWSCNECGNKNERTCLPCIQFMARQHIKSVAK